MAMGSTVTRYFRLGKEGGLTFKVIIALSAKCSAYRRVENFGKH